MPKSLVGFAAQSLYVGVGLMCRQFTNLWYTTRFKEPTGEDDYSSTVPPCMTPEKKLVYQVFGLLNTHVVNAERTSFSKTFVSSVKDQISVDLKREVLERSMSAAPATSADSILATLNQVYQETIDGGVQVGAEEELDEADLAQVTSDDVADEPAGQEAGRVTKKKMHDLIGKDLFALGKVELGKKDIAAIRADLHRRRMEKSKIRECIIGHIDSQRLGNEVKLHPDIDYRPSWQRKIRNCENNLGLTYRD